MENNNFLNAGVFNTQPLNLKRDCAYYEAFPEFPEYYFLPFGGDVKGTKPSFLTIACPAGLFKKAINLATSPVGSPFVYI
jgi:hypothetical protein